MPICDKSNAAHRGAFKFMNITELSKQYKVTRATIINWVKKGCPHERVYASPLRPNTIMFNAEDVQAWIDARNASRKGGEA